MAISYILFCTYSFQKGPLVAKVKCTTNQVYNCDGNLKNSAQYFPKEKDFKYKLLSLFKRALTIK